MSIDYVAGYGSLLTDLIAQAQDQAAKFGWHSEQLQDYLEEAFLRKIDYCREATTAEPQIFTKTNFDLDHEFFKLQVKALKARFDHAFS